MESYRDGWCKRFMLMMVTVYILASPHLSAAGQENLHVGQRPFKSHTCFSCHDGLVARNVTRAYLVPTPRSGLLRPLRSGNHLNDHPMGMDYTASFLQKRGALKPIAALPPSVQLEDGRVGCISCHNPSSSLQAILALPQKGSILCAACHNL
jgi:predicted CXXCH cytochrome family protein